ncbi:MAG: sulfur carrier protein ThiS [Phycisphaerales bacterium]|jgi:thiamine biosynthesis protein ThiS|nr:sulfur carrier protein ThiS [Phycisphaerales bacterium]
MNVKLNGQDRPTADGQSVRALLDELKLSPDRVAIELNRRLLRTDKYDTALRDGDELEIVTFVGGG